MDKIVKSVLNLPVLSVTKFPVGLQSHVEDVICTIKNKSMDVCVVGICGMGGSGKTTLAKAIYHKIHGTFMEKSFIEDIAQVRETRGGIHIQEQLLSDVLKTKVEVHSVEMGRSMIRERLFGKRVLIVLDDMDHHFRLLGLTNSRSWLSEGSVIIITTGDEDLLRIHQADSVFQMKPMNANDSLKLLSWHAFREAKPKEEYNDLAKRVVNYCGGLPLALEVIGSSLFERTKHEWNRVLLILLRIPKHDVQHKLKIGFNGLGNDMEKDLFLDVCCFFVGKGRAYVTKILNGCGVDADSGIRVLIERSLIQVKRNNKLGMHPLIQEMGREINGEISREESWMNNRLWFDDAEYVLTYNKVRTSFTYGFETSLGCCLLSHVQYICLSLLIFSQGTIASRALPVKLRSARREPSRLLKLAGNSEYVSKKLRWISLQGFSSEYLPNDFYLHDAIAIYLKHCLLRLVWKEPQVFITCHFH